LATLVGPGYLKGSGLISIDVLVSSGERAAELF